MRMRTGRMLAALLGILAVAVFAPQLASADTSTGALSGTVTNAAGQDIAGVQVTVTNVGTGNSYSATTAADGTYTAGGLPAGSYQVLFVPNNQQGQDLVYQYFPDKSNAAAAQTVLVTAGQTTANVNATLATGATISGRVTDAGTGAGLSGVYVYVYNYGGFGLSNVSTNMTTTDSTGAWSFTGLPTGAYEVQFQPQYGSNYASQYWNSTNIHDPPTLIALTAGSTKTNVDAALKAGGQISGTVTNGVTGLPAQGVSVQAFDDTGNQFATALTDAAGHYTLAGLSPSASYRVEFSPPFASALASEFYPSGASLAMATPVAVTTGQTTPNINETLSEGASISGTVTDAATGYPFGNLNVTLLDAEGRPIYAYNGGTPRRTAPTTSPTSPRGPTRSSSPQRGRSASSSSTTPTR